LGAFITVAGNFLAKHHYIKATDIAFIQRTV